MKTIAIANNKGGVGKTTTAVNLAAGVAASGKTVLLIDLDPQGNATQHLGISEPTNTISDVLRDAKQLKKAIIKLSDNLHLLPADKQLNTTARLLDTEAAREQRLKTVIKQVKNDFDYVIIDCMPALNILTHNALTAADAVYIPLQSQYLALHGLNALTDEIEIIKEHLNKKLKIAGIIITQYDGRTVLNKDILTSIESQYAEIVFSTPVRQNIALAEAPTAGQSIFEYAPDSNGTKDYQAIVNEFLNRNN